VIANSEVERFRSAVAARLEAASHLRDLDFDAAVTLGD
jgi:hypothetical protein